MTYIVFFFCGCNCGFFGTPEFCNLQSYADWRLQ